MKKILFLLVIVFVLSVPCFSEVRMDIGFDIPRGVGSIVEGDADMDTDFFKNYILPFPEASIYYQEELGSLRFGGGVRLFTFILQSIYWPNLFIEADLYRFTFALQTGGAVFGTFGLAGSHLETGKVFLPDLSAWFRIGNTFRVGGGVLGLMLPELTDDLGFAYYFGAKFALTF